MYDMRKRTTRWCRLLRCVWTDREPSSRLVIPHTQTSELGARATTCPSSPTPAPHRAHTSETQHKHNTQNGKNVAGGREGDMPECAKAGVTANDDGRRPSSSEFGSYLYVVPHPLLPQTVLTVVTLLRANGAD